MIDDITAAIDSLRPLVPDFDRAWYAAQRGEEYPVADELAVDVVTVLEALAREAAPDIIALGLNPDDRDALRNGVADPAVTFYLQCYEARATFRHWGDVGDFDAQLGAVELAAHKWLGSGGADDLLRKINHFRRQRLELGKRVADANARAIMSKSEIEQQQSGLVACNERRARDVKLRAAKAWNALGRPKTSTVNLFRALRNLCAKQISALAEIYGYDDPDTFLAEANNPDSGLRRMLSRDSAIISTTCKPS
ncbi:hypothetical protein GS610_20460 [Ruegeria sp. HKCCD6228]|uniref:hypothetical protein n=1 Tax=Ruegeria sp. HKCCD6228 TaxID=2683001 RepID=UPI00149139FF|nr:hypothetical protein [Ruegeria sp. HKCCD6228]NOD99588.1 hypothetical protein [Ruegeria sp. HKCCD6228]